MARGWWSATFALLLAVAAAATSDDAPAPAEGVSGAVAVPPAPPVYYATMYTADPPAVLFLSEAITVLANIQGEGLGYVYYLGRAYSFYAPKMKARAPHACLGMRTGPPARPRPNPIFSCPPTRPPRRRRARRACAANGKAVGPPPRLQP